MNDQSASDSMLSLPATTLAALGDVLAENRSPEAAAHAARLLGFRSGMGFHAALEGNARSRGLDLATLEADRFWTLLGEFFSGLGWGGLEYEALHAGVGALSATDWAEAELDRARRQPSCHFTTGMLSDLLGRLVDRDVAVMEVECRARGDQRCRFLFGSEPTLERVYDEVRAGQGYPESVARLG